jgi:hypothetical protein
LTPEKPASKSFSDSGKKILKTKLALAYKMSHLSQLQRRRCGARRGDRFSLDAKERPDAAFL